MTRAEKTILINKYSEISNLILRGFDYKEESKKDLSYLLDQLGLKINRVKIDNNFEMEIRDFNSSQKYFFELIFEYFLTIDQIIDFDLFDHYNDHLEIDCSSLTDELKKCVKNCYKAINNY